MRDENEKFEKKLWLVQIIITSAEMTERNIFSSTSFTKCFLKMMPSSLKKCEATLMVQLNGVIRQLKRPVLRVTKRNLQKGRGKRENGQPGEYAHGTHGLNEQTSECLKNR